MDGLEAELRFARCAVLWRQARERRAWRTVRPAGFRRLLTLLGFPLSRRDVVEQAVMAVVFAAAVVGTGHLLLAAGVSGLLVQAAMLLSGWLALWASSAAARGLRRRAAERRTP